MQLQPLVLAVLGLPSESVDPEVVASLREVLVSGHVTLLDMAVVTRSTAGEVTVYDLEHELETIGLTGFPAQDESVLVPEELTEVADALAPGRSAVVLAYEESWAHRFIEGLRDRGGEVLLHAQFSVHPEGEEHAGAAGHAGAAEHAPVPAPGGAPAGGSAVAHLVRKLESLADAGALDEGEVELAKAALLGH
jgi:ABC-type branched-subunit amino acid transport system substrate-binding protein